MTYAMAEEYAQQVAAGLDEDYVGFVAGFDGDRDDAVQEYWAAESLDVRRVYAEGDYSPTLEILVAFGGPTAWVQVPVHGDWVTVRAAWWSEWVEVETFAPAYARGARGFFDEILPIVCRDCHEGISEIGAERQEWGTDGGLCEDCGLEALDEAEAEEMTAA